MPDSTLSGHAATLRLYGRRKGKRLRPKMRLLLDTALNAVRVDLTQLPCPFDPRTLFDPPVHDVWLEIGFGAGEHLAAQAKAHPKVGFIGADIFENGIASLLRHCNEGKLANVRIFYDDARALIPALAPASLSRVFLPYPDPWPKRRHSKRRFFSPETLDSLALAMAPESELRVATDHPVYARWCMRHGPVHAAFRWQVSGPQDWRQRPRDGFSTRYEERAVQQGRTPMYLTFLRETAI